MTGGRRLNKGKINGDSIKTDLAGEGEGGTEQMQDLEGLKE
jgi:hypothetical protein